MTKSKKPGTVESAARSDRWTGARELDRIRGLVGRIILVGVVVTFTGGCTSSEPNLSPSISIGAPDDGAVVPEGSAVELLGSASDPEEGDVTGAIRWSSDRQGVLGSGGRLQVVLVAGMHRVTASVQDAEGASASAAISVEVLANTPPTIGITAPIDGATLPAGSPVTFQGTADDEEDGDLSDSIEWSSDREGLLGRGGSLTKSLRVGEHEITAAVADSDDMMTSVTVRVTVVVDEPPTLTVRAPVNGLVVMEGEAVQLSATASDPEDGDLTSVIEWLSDRDGALGVGGELTVALSVGTHVVSASATDSNGQRFEVSRTVEVEAAPASGIVFTSDRESEFIRRLYRISPDGSGLSCVLCDTPLGSLEDPTGWPGPTGEIAFVANEASGTNVYSIGPDGSDPRLISNANAQEDAPAWAADGSLFWTAVGISRPDVTTPAEIWGVSGVGGAPQTLVRLSSQLGGGSAVSPDGRWFAFHDGIESSVDLQIVLLNTSTLDLLLPSLGAGTNTDASFAPDGSTMAFVSDRDGNSEIYVADLAEDGTVTSVRRLTEHPGKDSEPSWSPDGSLIAFQSNRDGNNEIYVVAPDGSGLRNVTNAPAYDDRHPTWDRR